MKADTNEQGKKRKIQVRLWIFCLWRVYGFCSMKTGHRVHLLSFNLQWWGIFVVSFVQLALPSTLPLIPIILTLDFV